MNNKDLGLAIAKGTGITQADGIKAVTVLSRAITGALRKGNSVSIAGLGILDVKKSKARAGMNPKTREPIQIPARLSVRLKPSRTIKNALK